MVGILPLGDRVVQARDLVYNYGPQRALNGLSLQIPRGVSFGLLGPNGSGKTTLIKLLIGLLKPHSGTLSVLGEEPAPQLAARIGYMPQLDSLYQELSAIENLDFFARMYGMAHKGERRDAVEEALKLMFLWERRKDAVVQLSGGMRQRVNLAIALVHKPSLLLLDEPTVGLDPELRVAFWDHFNSLVAGGATLVISSHTMDDAAHCDSLAFLVEGKVIAQGSPDELRLATGRPEATLEETFLYLVRKA